MFLNFLTFEILSQPSADIEVYGISKHNSGKRYLSQNEKVLKSNQNVWLP